MTAAKFVRVARFICLWYAAGMSDLRTVQPATIIVRYDAQGQQWCAAFDGKPQIVFDGNMPAVAIRRLLEGTEAEPDEYALICDADLSGTGAHTIYRSIIWNPPELLLPCGDCQGRGEYVGLLERKTCTTCGGRKVVPV
jgi:hypothetical protein